MCVLAQARLILCDSMDYTPRGSSVHGKTVGVGCHFLLQGIFLTQGRSPVSPALARWVLPVSNLGSLDQVSVKTKKKFFFSLRKRRLE